MGADVWDGGEVSEAGMVGGGEVGEEGTTAGGSANRSTREAVMGRGDGGGWVEVRQGVADMERIGGRDWPLEVEALFGGDGEAQLAEEVRGDGSDGCWVEGGVIVPTLNN